MNEINWSAVRIRCSSLGSLFTEPVSKANNTPEFDRNNPYQVAQQEQRS